MLFQKSSGTYDFMIAGLGNPGMQYENTRHNIGFMIIDRFAEKHGAVFRKSRCESLTADCRFKDLRLLLVKPQTFMNDSGRAVSGLSAYYKVSGKKTVIIFDDVSLDVGNIRLRRKGSDGGHNGIKDIIQLTGTEEIMRIKAGIGHKPNPGYDLKDWVLGKFRSEDAKQLDEGINKAVSALETLLTDGIDAAMNSYNS